MTASAGSLALHPVALLSLVTLVLNDHWAKARFSNALTGKLSDVAGLVLVPVVIVSTVELVRGRALSRRWLAVSIACALTGALFALCKGTHFGAELYRAHFGSLRAPLDHLISWVSGAPAPSPNVRVAFEQDPTDLYALFALMIPLWITRAVERGSRTPRSTPERRTPEAAARA